MIRDGETLGFLHLFREIWRRDFEIVSGAVLEKDILVEQISHGNLMGVHL